MDASAGDVEGGSGEDPPAAAGRKKGRFKQLKSRLFGRLKRKEAEGTIKQSKSASDVTSDVTAQGAIGDYDSEDDCLDDSSTLGSRALSHDSIFQTDQSPSSPEPTRVLSQENVHGKIRALQQKLQQQNMRLGPPPLLISSKRMEDSGATSEDDGLPRSPPDTSFHDRPGHGYPYKGTEPDFPDSHRNRSCLSLAGTGSEEEEQWSSQPSSRPLSPGSPTAASGPVSPTEPGLSQVLDLTTPAQYTPGLDTSAARHRMSVKPRNQRASSKTRKGPPSSSRPRPDSQSDLDQALSEKEDEEKEQERTDDGPEAKSDLEKKREGSVEKLADHPFDPVPSSADISSLDILPPFPEDQDLKPWFPAPPVGEEEVLPPLECPESEGRVINNPLFLKTLPLEPVTLVSLSPTTPTEAVEGLQPAPKPGPNRPPIYPGPGAFTSDIHKDPGDLTALTLTEAVRARLGSDPPGLGAAERSPARPSPPAPVASESPLAPTPACVTGIPRAQPPGDPETTAPAAGEEDKRRGGESAGQKEERRSGSSHRFSISSARHRPRNRGSVQPEDGKKDDKEKERNGEGGKEGGEGKVGPNSTRKGCMGRPVVQPEARQVEVGRKTENQRDGPAEKEEDQEVERKSAFGVKLRLTSQSLKYRSEVSQSDFSKRHSYEFLANGEGPEPITGKLEDKAGSKVRDTSSQAPPQQADISSVSTGKELDPKPKKKTGSTKPFASRVSDSPAGLPAPSPPEPAWMSMAREKSRSLQRQITSRPPSTEISLDMALYSGGEILPDQPDLQPPPGFLPQGSPSPTIYSSVPSRTETAPAGNKALLDKGQTEMSTSRPVVSSSAPSSSPPSASTAEPCLTPRSQPSWLELAKRKSKAWCDKTMD